MSAAELETKLHAFIACDDPTAILRAEGRGFGEWVAFVLANVVTTCAAI